MEYINELEKLQEQIKELFKESVSQEFYNGWEGTFEIEEISDNRVVLAYYGEQDIKEFKKECKQVLWSCICSVAGYRKKFKIRKKKKKTIQLSPKVQKNIKAARFLFAGIIFVLIATVIIVILCNYIGNRNFRESFYSVSSLKVNNSIRVVHISDLHGSLYGKDNHKLIERVEKLAPDVIICTGDIVDSAKNDVYYAVNLGSKLSKIAPCYYIYGNNEAETIFDFKHNETELDKKFGFNKANRDETKLLNVADEFAQRLEKSGIKVLKNQQDTIKVGNTNVDIYGVLTSNPSAFWSYTEKSFANYIYENTDNLKITAVHEPFIFEEFNPEFWGDLMVCGHTHGGEIRVPVLGPLYTHEGGLFPERNDNFVYGRYDVAGKPLIVSSGLENKNILRINNQPELVIIDINKF